MNAPEIVFELAAAGAEMNACCDRIDAREREILDTMDHFGVSREYAIQMIHWSRDNCAASDKSIAREYGQGRYMGD